jgi:hypothetical protein
MAVAVDITRPYEPLAMTTAAWAHIPPVPVALDTPVVFSQEKVSIEVLLDEPAPMWDDHPHLVRWRGQTFVVDGHHRWVRARLRGEATLACRVLEA